MGAYIIRRLIQAIFTVLGVMLITFLLFRMVSGDIAGAHLGPKATAQQGQLVGFPVGELYRPNNNIPNTVSDH